jgi:hypothetical protein
MQFHPICSTFRRIGLHFIDYYAASGGSVAATTPMTK